MTNGLSRQLHAYFAELADEMNENELGVGKFLTGIDRGLQIEWTSLLVKEIIWRSALVGATGKESTRELTDEQAEKLFGAIADRLQENYEINIWERLNNN